MNSQEIIIAGITWIFLCCMVFKHSGFHNIWQCFRLWFSRAYWTNYNIVEFAAWTAKAVIIIPGLIFGLQIWWLYFFTLGTSLALIWASNKKLLPTLVGFNVLWVGISCVILTQHLLK